jgi:hypothetical protein
MTWILFIFLTASPFVVTQEFNSEAACRQGLAIVQQKTAALKTVGCVAK